VWIDDSGYGEVKVLDGGRFETVARLPGWTRGLSMTGNLAFVATSRVIPRFARYAPGLDVVRSRCALHALDLQSGRVRGSLTWEAGNQIFAVERLPPGFADGLPLRTRRDQAAARSLFYAFSARSMESPAR
jgi:hypothetical protein